MRNRDIAYAARMIRAARLVRGEQVEADGALEALPLTEVLAQLRALLPDVPQELRDKFPVLVEEAQR